METTYTILGADGLQYGPINLSHLKIWITEGRITPTTQVLRSDINAWHPAAQYTELGLVATATAPSAMPTAGAPAGTSFRSAVPSIPIDPALERQAKSGAGWFFWIAGLSLINAFIAMSTSSGGRVFVLGLGITQLIGGAGAGFGGPGIIVSLCLNLMVTGLFVLFGVFARKGHGWSFIVGMVLYLLDALIFVLAQDWLGVGFHAFALFCIFRGFKASSELKTQLQTSSHSTGQLQF